MPKQKKWEFVGDATFVLLSLSQFSWGQGQRNDYHGIVNVLAEVDGVSTDPCGFITT